MSWGIDNSEHGDGPVRKAVLQRLATDPDAAFPALPSNTAG